MRFFFCLLFLGLTFSGCGYVTHLDEVLRLKSLSDDQAQQQRLVQAQNKKFEALVKIVKENRTHEYPDKQSIVKAFGDPIFKKNVTEDGKQMDKWLYRYAEKFIGSEKVYLYFDSNGKLVKFNHVLPPPKPMTTDTKETSDASQQKT